ncbi:hypothetical protein P692DRAFT_20823277 [Suillus brevipes Sb2]|nr:hypothetical protein P692DRAFT_20823277 [Suillus brevipes Sb2]
MPCTSNENDSDEADSADGLLRVLHTDRSSTTVLSRGHCAKNTTHLTESITAELEGSQDVPAIKSKPQRSKKSKTAQNSNRFNGLTVEGDLDDEGSDYASPSSSQEDTTSASDHESDIDLLLLLSAFSPVVMTLFPCGVQVSNPRLSER